MNDIPIDYGVENWTLNARRIFKMKSKGKVLFIIHDLYQEDNHLPLGVAYMGAALKKQGVEVVIE